MKSIEIGKLGRPHGVRGEIRLFLFNPDSESLADGMAVELKSESGATIEATIERIRYTPKFAIIKFAGLNFRDEVDRLTNAVLHIDIDLLPELDDDEFYVAELIGLPVYIATEEDGEIDPDKTEPIGTVDDVFDTGANEVIVVVKKDGQELLVPLVEHAVSYIDLDEEILVLQPLKIWAPK